MSLKSIIVKTDHSMYYVFILDEHGDLLSCCSRLSKRGAKKARQKMITFWREYHPLRERYTDPRMQGTVYEQVNTHNVTIHPENKNEST